jgi:hypothetical protein
MKLIGQYYKPTVGLMHVTLPEGEGVGLPHMECYRTGELTPQQALVASEWLGLKEILVSHYVDPECEDVKEFLSLVENNSKAGMYAPTAHVLNPGDVLEL